MVVQVWYMFVLVLELFGIGMKDKNMIDAMPKPPRLGRDVFSFLFDLICFGVRCFKEGFPDPGPLSSFFTLELCNIFVEIFMDIPYCRLWKIISIIIILRCSVMVSKSISPFKYGNFWLLQTQKNSRACNRNHSGHPSNHVAQDIHHLDTLPNSSKRSENRSKLPRERNQGILQAVSHFREGNNPQLQGHFWRWL